MGFWNGQRVVVTGGAGFLGSHIVERLQRAGADPVVPRKKQYNLIALEAALRCFQQARPTLVIHGAANYGGIGYNQLCPGTIFYENLVMGANAMEAARQCKVDKFVAIGTACSYPGYLEGELREESLWDGPPHETVINYGLTKKMMAVQGWAYQKQFGFRSIHLILTNLYGPRDSFHPERSHVVSALIRKFVEAKMNGQPQVDVWGTGRPIREFLYVEDCADAILRAAELYDDTLPLNIGTGRGTAVRELVSLIQEITAFAGELSWNTSKPDGQLKKVLNVSRMRAALQWSPPTDLRTGLRKTIEWYEANKEEADGRY